MTRAKTVVGTIEPIPGAVTINGNISFAVAVVIGGCDLVARKPELRGGESAG